MSLKKKIIKLSFETDFQLIGISTRLSAHKLSWLLNIQIDTNFKQVDDLLIKKNENGLGLNFAVYEYETKSGLIYKLFENKNNSGIFIKKLNNIDYLLKIDGNISEKNKERLIKKIRETESVVACLSIDIQNIKQKEMNLLV